MARKKPALGAPDCGSHVGQVVAQWLEGYGPGGPRSAFPSKTARIAAGQALQRVAQVCLRGDPLLQKLEAALDRDVRAARKSG